MSGLASVVAAVVLLQGEPEQRAAPPAEATEPAATPAVSAPVAAPPKTPAATSTSTPTSTSTSTATPTPTPSRTRVDPALERGEAEKTARAFLDALVASNPAALAAAASDRFSFDGDTVAGRDAIRSQWRALLSGRQGPQPRVVSLEVLPAADAVARLGKPPARIAPLARPGAWVALADVSGRPVVLFVARENGRMAVLGMHD